MELRTVNVNMGEDRVRLEQASQATGKTVSALVRLAVSALLSHLDSGGTLEALSLPRDLESRLQRLEAAASGGSASREELAQAVTTCHESIDRLAQLLSL
jgi:predicted DNA-binding protein